MNIRVLGEGDLPQLGRPDRAVERLDSAPGMGPMPLNTPSIRKTADLINELGDSFYPLNLSSLR